MTLVSVASQVIVTAFVPLEQTSVIGTGSQPGVAQGLCEKTEETQQTQNNVASESEKRFIGIPINIS